MIQNSLGQQVYDTVHTVYLNLRIDYHEQVTTTHFYTGSDFVSKVGGYHASFIAVWKYIAPFFLLYFLYNLALVIKNGKRQDFKTEMIIQVNSIYSKLNEYRQGFIQIDPKNPNNTVEIHKPIWSHDENVKLKEIDCYMEGCAHVELASKKTCDLHKIFNDMIILFNDKLKQDHTK